MSSVSLPCPACSTPLILDEDNAGAEVLCPGCDARLQLPETVSAKASLTLLARATPPPVGRDPSSSPDVGVPATAKPALPKNRTKSDEEELKRLAAAAAAAGGPNSFKPDEVGLPGDHRPVVLPSKRVVVVQEAETSAPAVTGPAGGIPTARRPPPPQGQPGGEGPDKQYKSREAVEISVTPTIGPSRFVRPAEERSSAPPSAGKSPSGPGGEETESDPDTESGSDPTVRGGYRLGLGRELHFSPMHTADEDGETSSWGAKVETEAEAARGRRFVSLAVFIAVLAASGVGFYMMRQAISNPQQVSDLADENQAAATASTEDVMRNVEDARRVLKRFLAADTVEKMALEVRRPEVTIPRMERFYSSNPLKPRKIRTESQSWSEIRIEDTEYIRAAMELDDFIVYPIALEIVPGAEPKVDWESFVNWAEMPWKDFLRTPPEAPIDFRVTVTLDPRDQYYNYSFKGRELDLLCFKLEDPGKYGSCWAYCDKDSEAATKLLFNLKRSRRQGIVNAEGKIAVSCILRLRFPPEGMKTNQVMIEKFLNDSWVQP